MHLRTLKHAISYAALAGVLIAPGAYAQTAAALKVDVLSSRPEMVSGGSALVRVSGATAAPSVSLGGADVSSAFKADAKGGGYLGLVNGLKDGDNQLVVKAAGKEASVTLNNHGINATLFAGPQQVPFICENETHKLQSAKDDSCAAPPRVDYYYRNKGNEWKPFDPAAARPTDIGTTKIDGKEFPLIVRQEKGVINRSAYLINILHDPAAGPVPTPGNASPGSGWNGKLIYTFGGGVQANYHMGRGFGTTGTDNKFFIEDMGGGLSDTFVTRGYAVIGGSLNVMGTNNDDVKSAETVSKIKEYFVKTYGPVQFTIGHGASGGSMQQHLIGNNYPGLLDGVMPARNYPDVMSFLQPLYDCELIAKATETSSQKWTYEQKGAVAGKYWGYCVSNGTRYPNARPTFCDATVADAIANDPALKQKGVRCTFQDNLVNIYGRDPKTGFARNPFDNVGVQYGLNALNEGKISFDQFLDLNARIGGLDVDGKIVPARQVADGLALRRAYASGRVNTGGAGLATTPMVDIRSYVDGDPIGVGDANVDVHDGYHSMTMRARLLKANGTAANHVMLTVASNGRVQLDTRGLASTYGTPLTQVSADGLAALDKWLTNIANDKSNLPQAKKVAKNKPADLVDACFPTAQGRLVGQTEKITDMAKCNKIFPFAGDARLAAGAPRTLDVFKCQLKPVTAADYKSKPNAAQLAKLKEIFPNGVCDYKKPGVEQVALAGTWAVFKGDGEFTNLDKAKK